MSIQKVICGTFFIGLMFIFAGRSFAQYNPDMGRFHQRDPLGIRPGQISFVNGAPQVAGTNGTMVSNSIPIASRLASNSSLSLMFGNTPPDPAMAINTSSGIDPLRQYQDGMNLYVYVKNNSINNADIFGLSTIIIGYNPSIQKCGICGPDITGALRAFKTKITQHYNNLTDDQKKSYCSGFTHGNGWDTNELTSPYGLKQPEGCGTGDCSGTVTVEGKCYSIYAVNYFLYGLMNNLCGNSAFRTVVTTRLYTQWYSGNSTCKTNWALWGHMGDPAGIPSCGLEFCKPCGQKAKESLSAYWRDSSGARNPIY